MDLNRIKQDWDSTGFCVIPNFIDSTRLHQLQTICDDILQQWFANASDPKRLADSPNMAFLTEPIYFGKHPYWLIELLELIAEPSILKIINFACEAPILFHNTQYFFNPTYKSQQGIWHRDTQFLAPQPELEKKRVAETTAVHFRIAFLNDNYLEYVPGSEKRWDTPEEYAIRKGENGKKPTADDMPGKKRIYLNSGDALLFHAWGIHRGVYEVSSPRRTLDIIYQLGKPCDYCPPPATCFRQTDLLTQLNPHAKDFFQDFINTYKKYWLEKK